MRYKNVETTKISLFFPNQSNDLSLQNGCEFLIFQLLGLAIAGLGVYFILDEERAHLHQLVMISLINPGDEVKPDLQPMMYFLSLGLIGSGLAMTLVALINLFSASKESQILLFIVSCPGISLIWVVMNYASNCFRESFF